MKQFVHFTLFILSLSVLGACSKGSKDSETVPPDQERGWLLSPSTGWEHVNTINYPAAETGDVSSGFMSPYDLASTGNNNFTVLYGANFMHSNIDPITVISKAVFKNNDVNVGSGTRLKIQGGSKRSTFYSQFVPNSAIPVFTEFAGLSYVDMFDENNVKQSRLTRNETKEFNFNYNANGDFIAASTDNNGLSHLWYARYPSAAPFMKEANILTTRGSVKTLMTIPFTSTAGKPFNFHICKEGTLVKFQAIEMLSDMNATEPNKSDMVSQGTLEGVDPNELRIETESLVTYTVQQDVVTFVLAGFADVNATKINKLHCFRWNKSTGECKLLWRNTNIDVNLSKGILDKFKPNAVFSEQFKFNKYLEIRLTPEGTLYTIFTKEKYAEPNMGKQYSILYTVGLAGTKELGRLEELYNGSVAISTCRYIDGSYYALVYPVATSVIKQDDPKFHMELVKLKQ
jgi:hypothetical protein